MNLKTNLHFHCKEDPSDHIDYTFEEGMDRAAELGFEVMALTLHNAFGYTASRAQYAASKNILLIPGIEKTIEGKHVVILNCDKDSEMVNTFAELRTYREKHPDVFILAPHPYYPLFSLQEELEKNIDLFDAIEQSWYYSKSIDGNKKAQDSARKHRLPFIATSDTHTLKFMNRSYAIIDAGEKTVSESLTAIKKNMFKNSSKPSSFIRDMLITQLFLSGRDEYYRRLRGLKRILTK
ncbi:MAG: PHP-associated domain-containing protein [bacterium]|nr:PHP-associated domain-containing protein [bacterium]